jgi:hypothetical protein
MLSKYYVFSLCYQLFLTQIPEYTSTAKTGSEHIYFISLDSTNYFFTAYTSTDTFALITTDMFRQGKSTDSSIDQLFEYVGVGKGLVFTVYVSNSVGLSSSASVTVSILFEDVPSVSIGNIKAKYNVGDMILINGTIAGEVGTGKCY